MKSLSTKLEQLTSSLPDITALTAKAREIIKTADRTRTIIADTIRNLDAGTSQLQEQESATAPVGNPCEAKENEEKKDAQEKSSIDRLKGHLEIRDRGLAGIDLSGENLEGMNLSYLNLEGANLSGCNLKNCKLICTNLKNTNLRKANLSYTRLEGANLSHADLTDSDLSYSNAHESHLILEGTIMQGTILNKTPLEKKHQRDMAQKNAKEMLETQKERARQRRETSWMGR